MKLTRRQRARARRACEGKVKHPDQTAAAAHAVRLRKTGARVGYYECPNCGAWHVGHTPWRVRQSIAAKTKAGTP